jgi:hypothetical protein
LFILNLVLLL